MKRRLSAAHYQTASRLAILAAVAGVAGLAVGCKPVEQRTTAVQPVQVMRVGLSARETSWSYVGVVRPRYETDLGFRVAGKVVERLVDVGQRVEVGQVIARLDRTDLLLAVEAQEAELMAARSSREQAVATEARFRTLLEQGHASRAAFDQRAAAADEARGRFERAERSLSLARNQLDYAELRAHQAGIVSTLLVEAGQVVALGQTVARIARLDALEAEVAVPEQMIGDVKAAGAEAEVWGRAQDRLPAQLRELAPEADRISRTYRARFSLVTAEPVELGRTVTVNLTRRDLTPVAEVPLSAVMNDGRGAHVWTVDASGLRVERRPVTVAALSREHVSISAGLSDGDRIVTMGVHMLDADKPIRIVEQRVGAR